MDYQSANLTHEQLAEKIFKETMLGGPDDYSDDLIVCALYYHIRNYMHGSCVQLSSYLSKKYGFKPVYLECKIGGDQWCLRHAMVTTSNDIPNDLFDLPVLDMAGAGTIQDRLELYCLQNAEFRVTDDSGDLGQKLSTIDFADEVEMEDAIKCSPGLTLALGEEFDVNSSLVAIYNNFTTGSRQKTLLADLLQYIEENNLIDTPSYN